MVVMAPLPPIKIKLRSRRSRTLKTGPAYHDESNQTQEETMEKHWRVQMKNTNPEKYAAYKAHEAMYKRIRTATMTEAEREKIREQTRERVRRFRMKKKEDDAKGKAKHRKSTKKSKKDKEKETNQREKWKLEKQRQRASWSEEKREEYNMKQRMKRLREKEEFLKFCTCRRKLKKERNIMEEDKRKLQHLQQRQEEERLEDRKKQAVQVEVLREQGEIATSRTGGATGACSKALARAHKHILPEANIYADMIADLIRHSTPRQKEALERKGIRLSQTDSDRLITENVAE